MAKKYDLRRDCVIRTTSNVYSMSFEYEWTPREIEDFMKRTFCINDDSIVSIETSLIKIYKYGKSS